MARPIDIAIFGAGIAGLWTFARLKRAGYDVLLLEREAIGFGQTIASQGIVHSGLKYSLAGKLNETARSISAMPDRWRAALRGEGEVDLSDARTSADSQFLLIPGGLLGGRRQRLFGNRLFDDFLLAEGEDLLDESECHAVSGGPRRGNRPGRLGDQPIAVMAGDGDGDDLARLAGVDPGQGEPFGTPQPLALDKHLL